jgi:hypothetical protein
MDIIKYSKHTGICTEVVTIWGETVIHELKEGDMVFRTWKTNLKEMGWKDIKSYIRRLKALGLQLVNEKGGQ